MLLLLLLSSPVQAAEPTAAAAPASVPAATGMSPDGDSVAASEAQSAEADSPTGQPAVDGVPGAAGATSASDSLTPTDSLSQGVVSSSLLPKNLSPWGMFMNADWVVKAVMIGLALASLLTWTILLVKSLELHWAVRRERRLHELVGKVATLDEARRTLTDDAHDGLAAIDEELSMSANALDDTEGVKERVVSRLDQITLERGRTMAVGTGILATIGATAPFVGLFGTVWGIMNSFIGISKAHTTNLAVVAPGIAEALLATALGLVAAIPAVIIYNHFARRISAYKCLLADISAGLLRLVSRDLSHRITGTRPAGARTTESHTTESRAAESRATESRTASARAVAGGE